MPIQSLESQLQMLYADAKDFETAEITLSKRPKLLRYVLEIGWQEVARRYTQTDRAEIKRTPIIQPHFMAASAQQARQISAAAIPRPVSPLVVQIVNEARERLLDMTIGGAKLRDCTRPMLRVEAGRQAEQAIGHQRLARFAALIANALSDDSSSAATLLDPVLEAARVAAFESPLAT